MAYLACSAFFSKNWRGSGIVNASYTPASSLGVLGFQNGGESNENTLGMRLTNTRYINSPGQGQLFFRLFPRKFQCSPSFNALLPVELAIYPMFIYKRLLMFNVDIHFTSCFSSLDILAIFWNTELSFLCIQWLSMNGTCLYHLD